MLVPGMQLRRWGQKALGLGRAGMQGAGPLTVLWVQPARRGLSGRAVRRSAGVSSRTRVPVIGGTAAAPARPASGASGARTVSAGVCGGRAPGPAEPCRPFSSRPLQSVSRAPLGWGAGRRAPALWAQPVTPSAVSVGSSVRLATAGRTVTKVSDGLCVQDRSSFLPAPPWSPFLTGFSAVLQSAPWSAS